MPRNRLPRLPALTLLLVACTGEKEPVRSAANTTSSTVREASVAAPSLLEPAAGPALRFRADVGAASASRQDAQPRAEGPFLFGETSVTLENRGATPIAGPLALVLPAATFAASVDGATGERLRESRVPERDGRVFETAPISLGPGEKKVVLIRHAALAPEPAAPRSAATQADAPKSVAFLLDTSLARTHQLARQIEIVTGFARSLPHGTPILVGAYDSSVAPLYEGKAGELATTLVAKLAARGAAGTSDLQRAMDWATRPRANAPAPDRIVVVSDGVDGLDSVATASIASAVKDGGAASSRVDVIVPRGPNDSTALRALTTAGSNRGALIALEDDAAVARLLAGGPERESFVGLRERAIELVGRDKPTVPAWLRADLESAAEPSASRSWERITALSKHLRGLPPITAQREQVDPMEDYSERASPAAEPVTVTLTEPTKPAEKKVTPELRPQIPPETIQQIVRRNFAALRFCYRDALRRDPKAAGSITIRFDIDETGSVPLARASKSELGPEATLCFVRAFEALSFPASPSGTVTVSYPLRLAKADASGETPPPPVSMKVPTSIAPIAKAEPGKDPWTGDAKSVYEALAKGDSVSAIEAARASVRKSPRELASHILLGDALAAAGDGGGAVRAYGSIVELAPRDPAALRLAGARLASLGPKTANAEAERYLTRALELDATSVSGYHMLAMLLAQRGAHESALTLLDVALSSEAGRSKPVRELFRADLGAVAQAFVASEPRRASSLRAWLAQVGGALPAEASLTIVASWEDAAADVDISVRDRWASVAEKGTPSLPTGGRVLGESGQAGGPETFTLERAAADYPYVPAVRMKHASGSFVAGALFRSETSTRGALGLEVRPFFVNVDGGRFEAAPIERPLAR